MPFILEQRHTNKLGQPPKHAPPGPPRRLSNIPLPVKRLVVDNQNGINHGSKPTTDILPITPAIKLAARKSLAPKQVNEVTQQAYIQPKPTIEQDNDSEVAILDLVPFSRQPIVNFGQVKVDSTKIKNLLLRNTLNIQQQLVVTKLPKADKGLYMEEEEFFIAPHTERNVILAWTPRAVGGFRESITLQDVNRMPRQIVLIGTGYRPKPQSQLQITSRGSRAAPRLFRRSPIKTVRKPTQTDRVKSTLTPRRMSALRQEPSAKPLSKLVPSPKKRHQIVRKILAQQDGQIAIKVQSYCRMILAQRQLRRYRIERAAITLQSQVRGYLARKRYIRLRQATLKLQTHVRRHLARERYIRVRQAILKLQAQARAYLARKRYFQVRQATLKLQAQVRCYLERKRYMRLRRATLKLQTQTRAFLARKRYLRLQQASLTLQAHFRGYLARRRHKRLQDATLRIQAQTRGYLARKRYIRLREATLRLQAYIRGYLARKRYTRLCQAVLRLQTQTRGYLARRRYLRLQQATLRIQAHARGYLARRRCIQLRQAILRLQTQTRGYLARKRYLQLRQATLKLQTLGRMYLERRRFLKIRASVCKIQTNSRGLLVRRQLEPVKVALATLTNHLGKIVLLEEGKLSHEGSCISGGSALHVAHRLMTATGAANRA